jgi:hypothetical protein
LKLKVVLVFLNQNWPFFNSEFYISQTNGHILILAISKYLSLTTSIYKDKTNNFKFKVSNVRSVENIVKFIKKAPVKLLGYKNYNIYYDLNNFVQYHGTLKI